MSYQVLARKWRPSTFSELVGQQHVVDAVTNALENNRLHHAYLFTGTRGVGKTTIARIFAKSLNCETGQGANPCGICNTCVDINDGRYVDLLEIDAASRTKVEDTRELLDNVQYKPTRGKFKVYLIDEVHMLSKHSFNALLKTLEEPPPHVKFLLATTDPQKLPVTILSRCLQFNLKALSIEQIQGQLEHILLQEQISAEGNALYQLAKAANGSMRDALSLTDQAIAQGNNAVNNKVVMTMLGLLDRNQILKLAKAICERNAPEAMHQLKLICDDSPDYAQVLSQLMATFHQLCLTQLVPEVCKLDNTSPKAIYVLANAVSEEHVQMLYQIALNGKRDLPHAPDAFTGLQMTVLRMLAFSPAKNISLNTDDFIVKSPSPDATVLESKKNIAQEQKVHETINVNSENPTEVLSEGEQADSEVDNFDEQNVAQHIHAEEVVQTNTGSIEPSHIPDVSVGATLEDTMAKMALFDELNTIGESEEENTSVKKSETEMHPPQSSAAIPKEFKQSVSDISARLDSGEKLTQASQVDDWSHFVDELGVRALSRQLLLHSEVISFDDALTIKISEQDQHLNVEANVKTIEHALENKFGKPIPLLVTLQDVEKTPYEIQTDINDMRLQHAKEIVESNEAIQELKKAFNAEVIPGSIEPR
ncbi:DNA polymerase III subunit gamma/tau [Agaribacter flavus]|uniref:DNA polymerase III subunit gamma/tau n=1 Tax=Agaribacter flavus TaxID=1902781 RepID=A0ABV7FTC0_9ALTE